MKNYISLLALISVLTLSLSSAQAQDVVQFNGQEFTFDNVEWMAQVSEADSSNAELSGNSQPIILTALSSSDDSQHETKKDTALVKEINGVEFVLRWIPPGIFKMGSPEDEEGRNQNEKQHMVKISEGFWMMDSEVTLEQWASVMGDNKFFPKSKSNFPVEDVSWNECKEFCKKAAMLGLPLELPTEAQWEYACRAGSKEPFAGDFEDLTWYEKNSDFETKKVRTRKPNAWGLYDMHGNVAEWCADWCGAYPDKPIIDPMGPNSGVKRITRGGSWGSAKKYCRSAIRRGMEPDKHTVALGFRCVLNMDKSAKTITNSNKAGDSQNDSDYYSCRKFGKMRALATGGGTTESERAVALGLQWIANHQLPNGAWSYNHQLSPLCRGECRNPGKLDKALNGATGMAILPFLGAGVTHLEGKYKKNVNDGLIFLCKNGKQTKNGVSFLESGGTIYSHGIAALCLTEAYGMTKDKKLLPAAQGSLNYIYFHQDPASGGWRYNPHQSGDTSASGWQLAALKIGYIGGLQVPQQVIVKTVRFFDSVQSDSGAKYGYTDPGAGPSTTAVGLMSRMYLGWRHENPNLQRGVEWLSKVGPSKSDSYYNYYATQLMYQYNGPLWTKWNAVIRPKMVNSQAQDGHEKGSWYHAGPWSERGGRLYDTALSTMVLEVYYRYPLIFSNAANP